MKVTRQHKIRSFISLATLAASATSAWATASPPLQISSSVSKAESSALLSDLAQFPGFSVSKADPELYSLMKIDAPNGADAENALHAQMLGWLHTRVNYIVDGSFNENTSVYVLSKTANYQNPGILPLILAPLTNKPANESSELSSTLSQVASVFDDGSAEVVMDNLGSELYTSGKADGAELGVKIPGLKGIIPITSPRVGILRIGPGLFSVFQDDPKEKITERYTQISQLATLFHEARHSDGNGRSLGFSHSICPQGHPYQGAAACDDMLNGAYTIQAYLLKAMTESCADCTANEKEALRLGYLDTFSRVVNAAPTNDATQELQFLQLEIDGCSRMAKLKLAEPADCAIARTNYAKLSARPEIPATVMNASPESIVSHSSNSQDDGDSTQETNIP